MLFICGRVHMRYVTYLFLSALAAVGLMSYATPTATGMRGAVVCRAAPQVPESSVESLDTWIDSVRRHHNIPAIGAIVVAFSHAMARAVFLTWSTLMDTQGFSHRSSDLMEELHGS